MRSVYARVLRLLCVWSVHIGAGQEACRRRVLHFSHAHRLRLSNVSTKHLFEACLPFVEHPC